MVINDLIESRANSPAVLNGAETLVPVDSAVIIAAAERELGAFMKAVTDSFGSGEAALAAEDWLEELDSMQAYPIDGCDWRSVTIAAASRLATRLNAGSKSNDSISDAFVPLKGRELEAV